MIPILEIRTTVLHGIDRDRDRGRDSEVGQPVFRPSIIYYATLYLVFPSHGEYGPRR